MKESTEDIILIEKYLEGSLEASDKQAFEERLNSDDNLTQLLEEYTTIIAGIKFSARDNMLANFQDIEHELQEEEQNTKVVEMVPKKNNVWYYAAASVILLCVAFFLFRPGNEMAPETLAMAYFEPYPATVGAASRSSEKSEATIASAMAYYESGEYDQTIDLLEGIGKNDQVNNFYLANAYQANEQYDQAAAIYKTLIQEGETFKEQATWNLALCHLSLNQKNKAVELLSNTSFGVRSYAIKAEKLLKELK